MSANELNQDFDEYRIQLTDRHLEPTLIDGMHRILSIRAKLERDASWSDEDSHPGGEVLG